MRRFRPTAIPGSEITPEASYLQRRDILRLGAAGGLALAVPLAAPSLAIAAEPEPLAAAPGGYDPGEELTPEADVPPATTIFMNSAPARAIRRPDRVISIRGPGASRLTAWSASPPNSISMR
jgi:hypothetical protein